MRTIALNQIVTDRFTGSKVALNGPGYTVVATSTSMDDNTWTVSAEAEEVDAGIPTRINVEAHEFARVMSELEGELQLVIALELHLSPA